MSWFKKFSAKKFSPFLIFLGLGFALLLFLTPLISKVNFRQNDDWNRVTSVGRFMQGDYTLLPVTATTFYTQGILGMLFSFAFGISNLPFLTLLVSILDFVVFGLILVKFVRLKLVSAVFLSLLVFFNPLHIYSMIGFMTENYTLLFVLLALYFFLSYEKSSKLLHLNISNLFSVLAFLCKQNGIVLFVATIPYLLIKKKYKEFAFQLISLTTVVCGYYLFFPITSEMESKGFTIAHLTDVSYAYSLCYGILITLTSFLLPIFLFGIYSFILGKLSGVKKESKKSIKTYMALVALVLVSVGLFFGLCRFFSPGKISWEEYPYFENTVERTGFLPRTVHGTKYQFRANYDLYRYWDLISRIVLSVGLACMVFLHKRFVNLYSIYIGGYLLLMVFTEVFFDRYILAVIPFAVLFLLQTFDLCRGENARPSGEDAKGDLVSTVFRKLRGFFGINSLVVPFVIFIAFFSMQLAYDFVYTQNYIWTKADSLVSGGVAPSAIKGSLAWQKLNGLSPAYTYIFSFDSPKVNADLNKDFYVVEEYSPEYRLNFFIHPTVYFYSRRP